MTPLIHCRPTSQDQDWHGLVVYKTPAEKAKKEFEKGLRDVEAGKRHVNKGDEHLDRAQAQVHEAEVAREAVIDKAGDLSEMQRTIDPQLAEARWQAFRTKIKGVVEIKEQEMFNRLIIELERLRDFLAEDKNRLDFEGKREEASRLLGDFRKELANVNRKFSENRSLQEKHPGLQVPDVLSGSDIGSVEEWDKALQEASELTGILRGNNAQNATLRSFEKAVETMDIATFEKTLEQKRSAYLSSQDKARSRSEAELKTWFETTFPLAMARARIDVPHSTEDFDQLSQRLDRWTKDVREPAWIKERMRNGYFEIMYGKYVVAPQGAYGVKRDAEGTFMLEGDGPALSPPETPVDKQRIEAFLHRNDLLFAIQAGADRSPETSRNFNYTGEAGLELIKQAKNARISMDTPAGSAAQWEGFKQHPLGTMLGKPILLIGYILMMVFAKDNAARSRLAGLLVGLGAAEAIGGMEGIKSMARDGLSMVGLDPDKALMVLREKGPSWLYEFSARHELAPRDVHPSAVGGWDMRDYLVFGFIKSENITFEQIAVHGPAGLSRLEHLKYSEGGTWKDKIGNVGIDLRQGAVGVGLAGLSEEDFKRFFDRTKVRELLGSTQDRAKNFASTFEETYRKTAKETKNAADPVGKKNIDVLNTLSAPPASIWKGEAQEDNGKAKRPLEIILPDAKKRQFVVTSETDGTIMARAEGFELGYENAAAFAKLSEHARASSGGTPAAAEEMKAKIILPQDATFVSPIATYTTDGTFRMLIAQQDGKRFMLTRSAEDERKAYTLTTLDAQGKATGTPTTFTDIEALNAPEGLHTVVKNSEKNDIGQVSSVYFEGIAESINGLDSIRYTDENGNKTMHFKYNGTEYVATHAPDDHADAFEVRNDEGYRLYMTKDMFAESFTTSVAVAGSAGGYAEGLLCNTVLRDVLQKMGNDIRSVGLDFNGDTDGRPGDGKAYDLIVQTNLDPPRNEMRFQAEVKEGVATFKAFNSKKEQVASSDFTDPSAAITAFSDQDKATIPGGPRTNPNEKDIRMEDVVFDTRIKSGYLESTNKFDQASEFIVRTILSRCGVQQAELISLDPQNQYVHFKFKAGIHTFVLTLDRKDPNPGSGGNKIRVKLSNMEYDEKEYHWQDIELAGEGHQGGISFTPSFAQEIEHFVARLEQEKNLDLLGILRSGETTTAQGQKIYILTDSNGRKIPLRPTTYRGWEFARNYAVNAFADIPNDSWTEVYHFTRDASLYNRQDTAHRIVAYLEKNPNVIRGG